MKTLIITGGELTFQLLEKVYDDTIDLVIAVDGALAVVDEYNRGNHNPRWQVKHNPGSQVKHNPDIRLDYIIGDFDTINKDILNKYASLGVKIETFPPEKNYTDTHLALEKAIEIGADNVIIIGATGSRMDHTLGNLGLLGLALDNRISCKIVNNNNEIYMIHDKIELQKKDGYFVSILPFTSTILGVCLEGFKYPLKDATIKQGETLGISNEIMDEIGRITIKDGRAYVIQACD